MTRKFWESLSSHLCPSSELLYPTVYAASPLGHQICVPNIIHPNINSWSPPSMLFISSYPSISATFFQLLQPKTLKDLESVIQKYSLFYCFPIDSEVKIKPGHTINTIFFYAFLKCILNTLLYYLLLFHPHL